MKTDNKPGHPVRIKGTAPAQSMVSVTGRDHRHGRYDLGTTTASDTGHWHLDLPGGVRLNTAVRAHADGHTSDAAHIKVHQILRIDNDGGRCHHKTGRHCSIALLRHHRHHFVYRITGQSMVHIGREHITVRRHGHVVGKGRIHRNRTFALTFVLRHRTAKHLALRSSGKNGHDVRLMLPGHRHFRIAT